MARGLLAVLLLVAGIEAAFSDQCINSLWSYFNGACYFFAYSKAIYLDAKMSCAAIGHNATLVSIHSHAEQEFLNTRYGIVQYWLGLEATSGVWSWIDGTPFDYDNFASASSMTKCPMANINAIPLGKWTTVFCTSKNMAHQGTLCKYHLPRDPAVETTTTEAQVVTTTTEAPVVTTTTEPVETTTTEAATTTPTEEPCSDNAGTHCAALAYLCDDPMYSNLVADQCPRTCHRCPSDDPSTACSDNEHAPCELMAQFCDSELYRDVATQMCPKTCNRCPSPCVDRACAPCSLLSFACEREEYREMMAMECPRTCGFCHADSEHQAL